MSHAGPTPLDQVMPFVGTRIGTIVGADTVNPSTVRHILESIEFDRETEDCDPAMIPLASYMTFAMPRYGRDEPLSTLTMLPPFPYHVLAPQFTHAMATTVGIASHAPLRFGDRVTSEWYLAAARDFPSRVGPGVMLEFETRFFNQCHKLVAVDTTSMLRFAPRSSAHDPPRTTARIRPSRLVDGPRFDPRDPKIGDRLVPAKLALTLQRLIMMVGANRDFAPAHHDPAEAKNAGAGAPMASSLALLGLIEKMLLLNCGLDARVRRIGPLRLLETTPSQTLVSVHGALEGVTNGSEGVELQIRVEVSTEPGGVTASGMAAVILTPTNRTV